MSMRMDFCFCILSGIYEEYESRLSACHDFVTPPRCESRMVCFLVVGSSGILSSRMMEACDSLEHAVFCICCCFNTATKRTLILHCFHG